MNKEAARSNMLKQQIRAWDILNPAVLDLFNEIPREQFMPNEYWDLAYADTMIPLPHGMFIPPPKEEAKVLQALEITKQDKILELGIGSGYLTVLLAKLAQCVYSVDPHTDWMDKVKRKLAKFNLDNVSLFTGFLEWDLRKCAPYDVIVVNGSLPYLLHDLRAMLAEGGRIFAVIGHAPVMEAMLFKSTGNNQWQTEKLFETVWPRLAGIAEPKRFLF